MLIKGLPGISPDTTPHKVNKKANELDKWKQIVGDAHKHVDQRQIDFVGNAILMRAMKFGHEYRVDGEEVFLFLLRVTQKWALSGQPVQLFIERLPNNLSELGIMKLAEESNDVRDQMGKRQ